MIQLYCNLFKHHPRNPSELYSNLLYPIRKMMPDEQVGLTECHISVLFGLTTVKACLIDENDSGISLCDKNVLTLSRKL